MKKFSFAVLGILGIVLSGLALAPAANAVYTNSNQSGWIGEPNG